MGRLDLPQKIKVLSSSDSPVTDYKFYAIKAGNNSNLVCQAESDRENSDDLALNGVYDGDESSPDNDYTIAAGDIEFGSFKTLRIVSGTAVIFVMNQ